MDDDQQFCLRWNNHQSTLISVFDTLLENGTLVDCTLAAEGKFLKAHKVVLSACSPYFATLLSQQYDKHPIFILKDVKFQELRAMMDYMYRGEVNISQDQLAALLKAAESLQIKGLSDSRSAGSGLGGAGGLGAGQKPPTVDHKPLSVPVASGPLKGSSPSGYTIEQKRPRHIIGGPSSIDSQCGSREGSSSPTSRKRKKLRRRSMDNLNVDNHEHSNSSSQSMQINSSVTPSNTSTAITSVSSAVTAASQAAIVAAQQAAASGAVAGASGASGGVGGASGVVGAAVTKKTDNVSTNAKLEANVEHEMDNENGDEHDDGVKTATAIRKEQNKRKQHVDTDGGKDGSGGELLIEPKSEYEEGNDETVEDLTLDDEELLEDLEQAGPSHGGGEGSSQGYAQWQVDRSQDDVFMAAQEAAGQQRDPQDTSGAETAQYLDENFLSWTSNEQFRTVLSIDQNQKIILYQDPIGAGIPDEDILSPGTTNTGQGINFDNTKIELDETVKYSNHQQQQQQQPHQQQSHHRLQQYQSIQPFKQCGNSESQSNSSLGANIKIINGRIGQINGDDLNRRFMCPKCGRDYSQKKNMRRHYRLECGREPQFELKIDKSEQTDMTQEEFELDDCILESNDIVITQNKDGFVLHVKKLGNYTTAAKLPMEEEQQQQQMQQQPQAQQQPPLTQQQQVVQHQTIQQVQQVQHQPQTQHHQLDDIKPQITALTSCHQLKLPSTECELIQLKKVTPSTSAVIGTTTIIQPVGDPQALNSLLGLREVAIPQKVIAPRIKYSRGKYSPIHQSGGNSTGLGLQITERRGSTEEKKYEIQEIDLNTQAQASIMSDLVKYAEIDDIELPDGTKIGIGFAPAEISEHMQGSQVTTEHAESPSQSPGQCHEATVTKSYTLLTTSPMKPQTQVQQTTTYELSLSDSSMTQSDENEKLYVCRHCGKKYRWKSTLRRHENVECGGKEPCHPCPYCSYKAKQRGNLGVHVRKHHPDKPQLESKRGRRTM